MISLQNSAILGEDGWWVGRNGAQQDYWGSALGQAGKAWTMVETFSIQIKAIYEKKIPVGL